MQSSISVLSHDVLALIFEINSEINFADHKNRRLNSARAASQVCQEWRALLLDLPKIWGRLIDLNAMSRGKSEWREEVLRRTRSSPLWITGTVPGSPPGGDCTRAIEHSFMIRLLKSWDRIQKFDVVIYGRSYISWEIKEAFLSPAPLLERFAVDVVHFQIEDSLYLHTDFPRPIFANHAPLLVTMKAKRFAFRTDSPWLANLREIIIPPYMEAPEILHLLSHTPILETLSFHSEKEPESWDPFDTEQTSLSAQIDLPLLSTMSLEGDFSTCTAILSRVSPARNCSLSLDCSYRSLPPVHIKAALTERLPTYIANYFTAHSESSTEITIKLDAQFGMFSFADRPSKGPRGHSFFRNALQERGGTFDMMMSLIQAIIASNRLRPRLFKNVTKLQIYLSDIPTSAYPDIYDMLVMFQSMEHLVTNEEDIHSILKLSPQDYHSDSEPAQPELFPSLHTLKLYQLSEKRSGKAEDDILIKFIQRRRHVGLPITKLDLTSVPFKQLRDFSALERMGG